MSDVAAPPTVPELFAAQARRTPDAPALGFAGGEIAYGELARRVERVAAGLRARGVGPETVVACALGRRPELVVALLAVMRAGGVHLPVDPDWPRERRAAVLADASARLVISSDRDLPDADPAPAPWPHPDSLAYVIYTSGSTGAPKGVMVAHRSLSNLVRAQAAAYRSGPGTRILQFAAAVFDGSISETLRALVSGAALVIARQADLMPGPALLACLRDRAITMATIPPTALAAMDAEPLPRLETLITAAEACPREVAERWSPGRRFLNAYGPTEATVCASFGEYRGEDRPPIGRPLAGVTLHVVDGHLRPAPGGRGELCVGGAGVARGYLGRPGPTAAAFLPDPFGPPGARMYRTGDLVRLLADGSHEFLGRGDRQVEVRGHRVEPGEVEAALTAHPAVQQAVCTAWTGADGALRLAAYVVAGDPAPPARELREFLRGRLPAYMVPARFVELPALPLLPSGKVDVRALPAPAGRPAPALAAAPASAAERRLAAIWAELLDLDEVGADEDFLELGGDSLIATRVLARVLEAFGVRLAPSALFERRTVSALALAVEEAIAVELEAMSEEEALRLLEGPGATTPAP